MKLINLVCLGLDYWSSWPFVQSLLLASIWFLEPCCTSLDIKKLVVSFLVLCNEGYERNASNEVHERKTQLAHFQKRINQIKNHINEWARFRGPRSVGIHYLWIEQTIQHIPRTWDNGRWPSLTRPGHSALYMLRSALIHAASISLHSNYSLSSCTNMLYVYAA